jgi:hypothetical protein
MYRLLSSLASAAALVAVIGATPSFAVPNTITSGNPGNAGTDNVLFNDSSLSHSGALVQGNFNGAGAGFIVDFTSASGSHLLSGTGGQATVSGLAGNDPFTSLTFGLEGGATFTKAILNADVVNGAPANATINFNVAYMNAGGSPFAQTFSVTGNGQNFFGIEAAEGAKITSVTFSSANTAFSDANQFRLGGFAAATRVPDGGTTATLLGVGLLALAVFRRKVRG